LGDEILSLESENILSNLQDGPFDKFVKDFCGSNKRIVGSVIDGKTNGPYKVFGEDGRLLDKGYFKNGLKHGKVESFWKDGSISAITNYDEGIQSGEFKSYYLSGKLRQLGENSDSRSKGTHWCETFTEEGILLSRSENQKIVYEHPQRFDIDPGAPYEL
tara:strand:- start:2455 stop:2934 length:480 start_codon:yes stop_codon:yes gene_type:complete